MASEPVNKRFTIFNKHKFIFRFLKKTEFKDDSIFSIENSEKKEKYEIILFIGHIFYKKHNTHTFSSIFKRFSLTYYNHEKLKPIQNDKTFINKDRIISPIVFFKKKMPETKKL